MGLGNRGDPHLCFWQYLGAWLSSAGPSGSACRPLYRQQAQSWKASQPGRCPSHGELKAALTRPSAALCLFLLLSAGLECFIHRLPAFHFTMQKDCN